MTYLEYRQKQTELAARQAAERAELAARQAAERAELANTYNSQRRAPRSGFTPFEQRKGWNTLAPAQKAFILANPRDYASVEDFTVVPGW